MRDVFDELCEDFPLMEHHLGRNSKVMPHAIFESGVVKILKGGSRTLIHKNRKLSHI